MTGAIVTAVVTVAAIAAVFVTRQVTGPAMQEWRDRWN